MSEKPGKVYAALAAIMGDISPVAKDQRNTQQGYNFRGIDDIYNAVNAIMAKHKVVAVPEVRDIKDGTFTNHKGTLFCTRIFTVCYTFYAEDGSCVSAIVVGEGHDTADKASNKAMAAAHKYALLQVFCIPTAEAKDSEADDRTRTGAEQALDRPPARYIKMLGAFTDIGWKEDQVMAKLGKKSWKELTDADYEKALAIYEEQGRTA